MPDDYLNQKTAMKNDKKLVEIGILLEEYKARRDEIRQTLDAAFATSNITLAGIAAVLSVSPFIYSSKLTGIFAIFSVVFHAISWTQLRFILQVYNLSNYINEVIAPRMRVILKELPPSTSDNYSWILSWELHGRVLTHTNSLWTYPIEAARYGIPLLASIVSFFMFILTFNISGFISTINYLLLVGNSILAIYSVLAVFKVRAKLRSGNYVANP